MSHWRKVWLVIIDGNFCRQPITVPWNPRRILEFDSRKAVQRHAWKLRKRFGAGHHIYVYKVKVTGGGIRA